MMANITFLSFLLFSMCHSIHVAVNTWLNCSFFTLILIMLTNDVKVSSIAASRGFSELTQNWIRSSHSHSASSLKISCKSVQPFSRNLANKERKIHTYKQRNRSKTIAHLPIYQGRGNNIIWTIFMVLLSYLKYCKSSRGSRDEMTAVWPEGRLLRALY